ncbi:hypothetical protein CHUAL_013605 [Chamberlinius hualienensis]
MRAILSEDQRGSSLELSFKYAVYRINQDPTLLPNTTLTYEIQYVPKDDSFHAGKKVCSLVRLGVSAIFGPTDPTMAKHVQSICNALDIPHIEARMDLESDDYNEFSVNLYPSNRQLNKAYADLIHFLNWTRVAIIYQDDDAFLRLQELSRKPAKKIKDVLVRQGSPATFREILKEAKIKDFSNIIVDTKPEHMGNFLRAILQLQMNDYLYHYLFTSFNVETFDLEDFKYNYVNITALRIVDAEDQVVKQTIRDIEKFQPLGQHILNSSSIIQAEPALMYDSVHALAHGLQSLERSSVLRLANVTCEDEIPWNDGSSLYNYINLVEFNGLTGRVQFKEGRRTNVKLDIMKLRQEGMTKVGEWSANSGINITNMGAYYDEGHPNITLLVTTIEEIPYVMLRKSDNVTGNDRYMGFCVDLLKEISKLAGFNYVLDLVPDRVYGVPDLESNEWSGMVRQLMDKKADLAVASLTINYAREKVIDFTKPFLNLGIGILFKIPTSSGHRLFSFMKPLAVDIWLYVLAAYIVVSLTMFTVARFSPYEWHNLHPCRGEQDVMENQFSLGNSFWFTIGTLMQQGSDLNPKATSTRIVGGIWWFFTLIIISSYTANLAAFLTVERMITPIENVDDLASQSEISYGTLDKGSTMAFFRDSRIETYQKMWRFMENKRESSLLPTYEAGIKKVLEGNFAFLMESTMLDYFIQRDCNLTQIGGPLDSKGYGIATQMGSPWRDKISLAILELQEKGVVQELYNRWWKNTGTNCKRKDEKSKDSTASALGVGSIGGVFVVLLAGLAIAILVAILEFCWNSKKNAQTDRQSLCSEMAEELRFAVRCRGSQQRPALRRQCTRCIPGTTYVPATMDIPQENGIMQMMEMRKSSVHFDCLET